MTEKIPVTVLTGYLGAGKTTLLNRILSEDHGQKFAVIVNEFGDIGIDNDLIVDADEEVFEMNNGCVCCTVRGDLIRIIEGLLKRRGKFDAILVETTGLADPAPVAQIFFVDADVRDAARLDAVVTVADAKWLSAQLKDAPEAKDQIAFADVILLNKIDPEKFLPWLQDFVQREGPSLLRSKGILAFKNEPRRFVFQGIHMLLDGDLQREWKPGEKRLSKLVFIGRNLPKDVLKEGFLACAA
jgi:G3E family GTPase